MKTGVKTHPSSVPHKVLRGPEGSEVLIALPNCIVGATTVLPICHQYRDLGAELGQFERASNSRYHRARYRTR
jgi:hypothetical protein